MLSPTDGQMVISNPISEIICQSNHTFWWTKPPIVKKTPQKIWCNCIIYQVRHSAIYHLANILILEEDIHLLAWFYSIKVLNLTWKLLRTLILEHLSQLSNIISHPLKMKSLIPRLEENNNSYKATDTIYVKYYSMVLTLSFACTREIFYVLQTNNLLRISFL